MSQQRAFPQQGPVQISTVRVVKIFLFFTELLLTVAIIAVVISLALADSYEVRTSYGMTKSVAVGYFVGMWFGATISIMMAYLLADIAESQRFRRYGTNR